METVRKTHQEQLRPTPQQARALEVVLWRCRTLDTVAREPRLAWGRRGQGSGATRCQQEAALEAALKEVRAAFPEDAALQSHSLQDVLARLDKTAQAFFRRRAAGQKAGLPRFPGRDRSHSFTYHSFTYHSFTYHSFTYHSFTYKAYGNGAHRDNGSLVPSTRGRLAVRWSRPRKGTPKTGTVSNEADGGSGACSCADVPTEPLPETGREAGIAVGVTVCRITAQGAGVAHPRHDRQAEQALAKAQQRVSRRQQGSRRRQQAVQLLAQQHQHVRRQRAALHHTTARARVRQDDAISVAALHPAHLSRRPAPVPEGNGGSHHPGAARKAALTNSIHDAGWGQFLHLRAFKAACAGQRGEALPPAYPWQDGSGWGARIPKSLSVRTHACAHPRLYRLRTQSGPRRERGQQYLLAQTAPAGSRGAASCGAEPRTRGALAPAECQSRD
jgi:putative transposase